MRGLPDNAILKAQDSNVPLPHMQEFRKLHLIGTESPSKSIKGSSFLISVRAAATGAAASAATGPVVHAPLARYFKS